MEECIVYYAQLVARVAILTQAVIWFTDYIRSQGSSFDLLKSHVFQVHQAASLAVNFTGTGSSTAQS
jgi:hypothetical protein